jgi:predicted dehydrogenase
MTQQSATAESSTQPAGDTPPAADPAAVPRIALVGVHGFGERHLANLARLEEAGAVELVAVADPNPPAQGRLAESVAVFDDLAQLLAADPGVDVVILATPIQTHAPLALAALSAGKDVYVEKPPVASRAQFEDVLAAAETAGRLVQVGFQSLGSLALPAIRTLVESGGIGDVLGLSATGQWVRSKAYFKRSRWAGKRSLDGIDVVDGVATNALAHAVATALHMAGAHTIADVESVDTDLYRAHDTESDDTSILRVRTAGGTTLLCGLTLCAAEQQNPSVTVHGTLARSRCTTPRMRWLSPPVTASAGRLSAGPTCWRTCWTRGPPAPRCCVPCRTPAPSQRCWKPSAPHRRRSRSARSTSRGRGKAMTAHPVVHGIGPLLERAAKAQATFAELGVPWARKLPPVRSLTLDGQEIAEYQDGSRIRAVSSPRPYLHPVRTLTGTVVTDHQPLDHVWHLGVGVALQDVDGINFWGGRTYTREAGQYVWRPDHGRITGTSIEETAAVTGGQDGRLRETLTWNGPDDAPVLVEERTWTWSGVSSAAWQLSLDFALSPAGDQPVSLGSPGSNGRLEGGYGGFFWRLPECGGATVWTPAGAGESEVHGSVTPWLAWAGEFGAGSATLVFVPSEGSTDPWFVRADGYPGVGQSLAWDTPVIAEPGSPVQRSITVFVADGILGTADIESLINHRGNRS